MRRAFTLVELIIYMGIFSIMLITLSQVFEATLNLFVESKTTSSVTRENTYLASRMSFDIHRASDILLPASDGESGSVLQLVVDGEIFRYQILNGRLMLNENGSVEELTGSDVIVQSFTATRSGEGVQIGWTLTSEDATRSYITTFATTQ